MDASALHRFDTCVAPLTARLVRVLLLLGYMPLSPVRPTARRMLLRSLLRATATLVLMSTPVFQKSRTLLGCAAHGPTPKNCLHGREASYTLGTPTWSSVSPGARTHPVVRPSSLGPQLSSAPSFLPPKLPSTKSNWPQNPWPYRFW